MQGAWYSLNKSLTIVHAHAFRIVAWQHPFLMGRCNVALWIGPWEPIPVVPSQIF
jgi:hypothetical protein